MLLSMDCCVQSLILRRFSKQSCSRCIQGGRMDREEKMRGHARGTTEGTERRKDNNSVGNEQLIVKGQRWRIQDNPEELNQAD